MMQQEQAMGMRNYDPAMEFGPGSPAAPHVARNPEKLQKVLRGMTQGNIDDRALAEHEMAGGYETGMVGAVDDRMSDSDTKTLALAGKGGEGGNVGTSCATPRSASWRAWTTWSTP